MTRAWYFCFCFDVLLSCWALAELTRAVSPCCPTELGQTEVIFCTSFLWLFFHRPQWYRHQTEPRVQRSFVVFRIGKFYYSIFTDIDLLSFLICYHVKFVSLELQSHSWYVLGSICLLIVLSLLKKGRVGRGERKRELFHTLVHSPNGFDDHGWARLKPGGRSFI